MMVTRYQTDEIEIKVVVALLNLLEGGLFVKKLQTKLFGMHLL